MREWPCNHGFFNELEKKVTCQAAFVLHSRDGGSHSMYANTGQLQR
jgi:hypothetical protein